MKSISRSAATVIPYFQVTPLALVFALFLIIPISTIVVVSFWDFDEYRILPDFIFDNYVYLLTSKVTLTTYINTLKYAVLVWTITFSIGFTVAYFLAFHVRTQTWQIVLFVLCTIPFWTSNIIRMISWVPFLGRNGLLNSTLISLGVVDEPLEFLLFSDFAVVLAFVHLYTLFMVVPIFNSMMRIDRSLIEAGNRRRGNRLAGHPQRHPAVVQTGDRHRLDLRRHPGHGRFHHGAPDERRTEFVGRRRHVQRDRPAAIPPPPPPMPWFC